MIGKLMTYKVELNLSDEIKKKIDAMTQCELARFYRFSPSDHPWIQSPKVWDYFMKAFNNKGGFTPTISKEIGWKNVQ